MDYREYIPGVDDHAVISLRSKVWGEDHPHTGTHFLEWMFQATPGGTGTGILMTHQGETVGFMGISLRTVIAGNQTYRVGHCLDLMVHPDFRSTLSSLKLINKSHEHTRLHDYDFTFGFPNNNSFRLVTNPKCGYQWVFSPTLLVRPLSRTCIGAELVPSLPGFLRNVIAQTLTSYGSLRTWCSGGKKPVGEICAIAKFGPEFDHLWHKTRPSNGITIDRNSAYLNWRFVGHPIYAYQKTALVNDGQLLGYVVTCQRQLFGMPTTLIVDILADNNDIGIVKTLLYAVLEHCKACGSQFLVTQLLPNAKLYQQVLALGFLPVPAKLNPKQFNFVMHHLGNDLTNLMNQRLWSFAWSDMDVV